MISSPSKHNYMGRDVEIIQKRDKINELSQQMLSVLPFFLPGLSPYLVL